MSIARPQTTLERVALSPCRLLLQDPNSRSEAELVVIRAFKDAPYKMLDREDRLVRLLCPLIKAFISACNCAGGREKPQSACNSPDDRYSSTE